MEIYRVRRGDSLFDISRKYKVSIDELIKVNDLPYNDKLAVGMNLLIPSKADAEDFFFYTVKPGDFLSKIAKKFKITSENIIDLNNLKAPYIIYPGQIIKIPTKDIKKQIETLPFFQPKTNYKDYYDYIKNISSELTYLAIFDIRIDKDGNLINEIPDDLITFIKENNIAPLPVITNFDGENFNSDLARDVLTNHMDLLINNIVNLTITKDYKGVVLDFEHLYPQDRNLYNTFVKNLSDNLHKNNKVLGMAIAPKWDDWADRPWVGFFDYAELGKHLDIAYIMTYEWGWSGGDPQPVAPLPQVKKVLDYALSKMPNNVIFMGINLYGYDWKTPTQKGDSAATVTLEGAYKLAIDHNSEIIWNDISKTPYFRYKGSDNILHEVHFEDALSQYYKHNLAKSLNLKGIGYWVLNTRISPTWYIVRDLFKVRKVI